MRKEVWIAPGIVYMCHPNKLITEHRTLNTEDSTLKTQHCYDNKTLHQTRACVDVLSRCRPSHGAHPPLAVDNEVPAIERCSLRHPPVEMDEDLHPSAGGADSEAPRRARERILTHFPPIFIPQMLNFRFNVTQRYITLHNITLPVQNFVPLQYNSAELYCESEESQCEPGLRSPKRIVQSCQRIVHARKRIVQLREMGGYKIHHHY